MGVVNEAMSRARYSLGQGVRVAWYAAHYAAARRMSAPFDRPGEPKFRPQSAPGNHVAIRDAFLDVFTQDRANIEAELYPAPQDFGLKAAIEALSASRRFFQDLPRVDARRLARDGVEVRNRNGADVSRYPAYYLQNFHYQTDGWLSEESAKLYDMQVEVLFAGAADAMRRIALGLLAESLRGQDQRRQRLIDVGCGSGRFLAQTLTAFPKLPAVGVDLSPAYVARARTEVARWRQASIVMGAGEALEFDDGSFSVASCIYLFHELPPKVRRSVARELARVVRPGGVLVFADSVQHGDIPDLDQMLDYFPVGFHEPFYNSYQREDLPALFAEAGFTVEATRVAFLTKVLRLRRSA